MRKFFELIFQKFNTQYVIYRLWDWSPVFLLKLLLKCYQLVLALSEFTLVQRSFTRYQKTWYFLISHTLEAYKYVSIVLWEDVWDIFFVLSFESAVARSSQIFFSLEPCAKDSGVFILIWSVIDHPKTEFRLFHCNENQVLQSKFVIRDQIELSESERHENGGNCEVENILKIILLCSEWKWYLSLNNCNSPTVIRYHHVVQVDDLCVAIIFICKRKELCYYRKVWNWKWWGQRGLWKDKRSNAATRLQGLCQDGTLARA